MIGSLKGSVARIVDDWAIVEVGGVGYQVYAAPRILERMTVGEAVSLSIETVVRDDMIRLYGFADESERRAFEALQSVQGVGAKAALAVLQVLPPAELHDAIALGDATAVTRAQGVGKKIAQRIVTELKGSAIGVGASLSASAVAGARDEAPGGSAVRDARSALINLGYSEADAARAVLAASRALGGEAPLDALIRDALKEAQAA